MFFALTGVVINQIFSGLFISGRVHNAGKNVYSLGDLYGIYYGRSGRLLSSVFGFLFCVGAFGYRSWRWAPSSRPPRASASSPPR